MPRAIFENAGPCKHRLDRFYAGLEDSRSYAPAEIRNYCFRWQTLGESPPIRVPGLSYHNHIERREVKKGHLVSIFPKTNEVARFHFTRLPSPLTGREPYYYQPVNIPISYNCIWDICLPLGLFAVATVMDMCRECVCLKVLEIKSLLTVRTRHIQVRLFQMKDGVQLPHPRGHIVKHVPEQIAKIDLLLTSQIIAVMAQTRLLEGMSVYVWNLEDGHPYFVGFFISLSEMS